MLRADWLPGQREVWYTGPLGPRACYLGDTANVFLEMKNWSYVEKKQQKNERSPNFNKKKEHGINVDLHVFSSTISTCSKHTIWLFTSLIIIFL